MTRWTGVIVLVVLAACGSGSTRQCTFNSDCPAGRYCTSAGACTADCASDAECTAPLGAGAVCSSFGQCIAPPDAGREPDAGAPIDGGPRDSGARDASDPDARSDAGPSAEVCTPSTPGSVPADEDGDGAIDEGCPWAFGEPHPLALVPTGPGHYFHPRLSGDGLSLFAGHWTDAFRAVVAHRASLDEPFGPAEPVEGEFAGLNISVFTPSADLHEAFLQIQTGGSVVIGHARRASTDVPFSAPTTLFGGAPLQHPALSPDELTLYVENLAETPSRIYRATRTSRSAEFGPLERVVIPDLGAVPEREGSPWAIDGGEGLLFIRSIAGAQRTLMTHRAPGGAFDDPVELTMLDSTSGGFTEGVSYSASTREVFFTSSRDWTPSRAGDAVPWRAEVCRDGACPARVVPCPTGRRSPDGLHCYLLAPDGAQSWLTATSYCPSHGGHIVTLNSEAEWRFVWTAFASSRGFWMGASDRALEGAFRWDWPDRVEQGIPEEPFIHATWSVTMPDNASGLEHCVHTLDASWGFTVAPIGALNDARCELEMPYVCEDELWPTW